VTTIRVMSETEKAIRAIFPDPDSQAEADRIFGECARSSEAQDAATREDIRRAAEGRRVLG
jgi:hypothetical protein